MTVPEVPHSLDEVFDPEWLSAALAIRFPGVEIARVVPGPEVSRISTNARFRIECVGDPPPGLPVALCVKGYFRGRGLDLVHIGEAETFYYRDLQASLGVRGMQCVYADIHPRSRHGVLIFKDVVEAGGHFLDALSPFTIDDVAESLEQFACLHGRTWGDPKLSRELRVDPRIVQYLTAMDADRLQRNLDDYAEELPDAVRVATRLRDAVEVFARRGDNSDVGWCLIQGDAHIGNVFVQPGGRFGLLDFQLLQRGHWSVDIGYHIASALPTDDREKAEADLLRHYLEALQRNGGPKIEWDDAWRDYRSGAAYGYYLWATTLLVDRPIIIELVHRLGEAVASHDSLGLLGV